MVIGLDIGTHSIKVASRIKNGAPINFAELRTSLLTKPDVNPQDEKIVVSVGDQAVEKYFNRDEHVPYNVELIEGDQVLQEHLIQALTALKIDPEPDLVALTVETEKFNKDEELTNLIYCAKKVFEKAKVFILDEAICAAAVYKKNHPQAGFLLICDLGKSALKLSLCDLKNDTIQIKDTVSITQSAWKCFENNLVQSFPFYRNPETPEIEKKHFRYDCLKSFIALDKDEKYSYINCLEASPGLLQDGGIHDLEFLSFGDPQKFLNVGTMHENYHEFVKAILSKLKDFIDNIEPEISSELPLPMIVIGSGASPTSFLEFIISSIENHSLDEIFEAVEIDNPKFTVAEGALRVISNEIKIYEPIKKQIIFKRIKLVDGFVEEEETAIEPKEVPMFGEEYSLHKFRFHFEHPSLVMKVGEEVLLEFQCSSPGEYELIQSMDCFGNMNLDLRKN